MYIRGMKENKDITETNKVGEVAETMKAPERKQKVSATYTLRACGENAKKLNELGLINENELITIMGIQKKAIEKYIKSEMGI